MREPSRDSATPRSIGSARRAAHFYALSWRCLAALGVCAVSRTLPAAELRLNEATILRFADVREGAEAITQRDDYIRQMGPLERQIRMQTDRPVTEQEFLAFAAEHVRSWSPEEIAKLTPLVESIATKLGSWKLRLPAVVLLVKTDGHEEAGAAYCRGSAIVLPENMIQGSTASLARVLPHEVFHIFSRHNPPVRDALYRIVGYATCNEVSLPEPLFARRITNPDAPLNRHYITVDLNGRPAELAPVLFSRDDRYDPQRPKSLFQVLDFKLMLLENDGPQKRPALVDGQAVLYDPAAVPGFMEQVGRNTKYLIHPEEVLADNFVFLLDGRINLPTPRIIEEMGKALQATTQTP